MASIHHPNLFNFAGQCFPSAPASSLSPKPRYQFSFFIRHNFTIFIRLVACLWWASGVLMQIFQKILSSYKKVPSEFWGQFSDKDCPHAGKLGRCQFARNIIFIKYKWRLLVKKKLQKIDNVKAGSSQTNLLQNCSKQKPYQPPSPSVSFKSAMNSSNFCIPFTRFGILICLEPFSISSSSQ